MRYRRNGLIQTAELCRSVRRASISPPASEDCDQSIRLKSASSLPSRTLPESGAPPLGLGASPLRILVQCACLCMSTSPGLSAGRLVTPLVWEAGSRITRRSRQLHNRPRGLSPATVAEGMTMGILVQDQLINNKYPAEQGSFP